MELPVENKGVAIRKTIAVNSMLIFILGLIMFKTDLMWLFILILFIAVIAGYKFIYRHNIKKVIYCHEKIIVHHNKEVYEIPIDKILKITSALNYYIKMNGRLCKMYVLKLGERFPFGDEILLEFDNKDILNTDPLIIKELINKITFDNNNTQS